jgi:hypothetical protein
MISNIVLINSYDVWGGYDTTKNLNIYLASIVALVTLSLILAHYADKYEPQGTIVFMITVFLSTLSLFIMLFFILSKYT